MQTSYNQFFYYAIIGLILSTISSCDDSGDAAPSENPSIHEQFSDLPDKAVFTHLPTDLNEMEVMDAMGQIHGIPKMHGGFRLLNPYTFPAQIPVYAMGDGYIYNIEKEFRTVVDRNAPAELLGRDYDDFSLNMVYSKHAGGYYGHVTALSEEILEQAGEIKEGRGVHNWVSIKITAGQVIGYVGPHPGLDIGMYDYEREHYFANQEMYGREYRSAVCFTDYLTPALQEQVWAITARTAEPRCGRVAYDKEGTLAGNWFLEGTTEITQWSRQLVFARHDLYGDRITIADASPLLDGDGIHTRDIEPYIWFVKGNTPMPEDITIESGPIKYEVANHWLLIQNEDVTPEGTLLIQLLEKEKIQYEYFEGKSAGEVFDFTSQSRIYVR
ncbi:MAG: hypothetical protein ACXIUQ_01115 [Cecembia sp.]